MVTLEFQAQAFDKPVLSAAEMLAHRWSKGRSPGIRPPKAAILVYQPDLIRYVRGAYRVQKTQGFFGDLFVLKSTNGKVAVAGNFGVGAPSAVIMLEELAAFGVKRFVSIGAAGGLQPALLPGSVVVCKAARRDEGTSAHYLPREAPARAGVRITEELSSGLISRGIPTQTGAVWTTDAPYRESWRTALALRGEGLLAVDMEAAALFTAGQALGVQVGVALVIADPVTRESWLTEEELGCVRRSLRKLISSTVDLLTESDQG